MDFWVKFVLLMQGFIEHFFDIPDCRIERTKKHKLIDILFITLSAVLCGCDEWEEIQAYGEKKESWLRKYVELPNGIPSHDTINRLKLVKPSGECVKKHTRGGFGAGGNYS